jgi:hypothetical protein
MARRFGFDPAGFPDRPNEVRQRFDSGGISMRVLMLGIVVVVAALLQSDCMADDKQIAEFVKARLQQEQQRGNLRGFNVDMRVDRGTVWFKGFVSNRAQEMLILRTAQQAGQLGVVQVVDDIEVRPVSSGGSPMQQAEYQQSPSNMMAGGHVGYQQPVDNQAYFNARPSFIPPTQQTPMSVNSNYGQPTYTQPPAPIQPENIQNSNYRSNMLQPQTPIQQSNDLPMPQMSPYGNQSSTGQPLAFASAAMPSSDDCYSGDCGTGCVDGYSGGPVPMGSANGSGFDGNMGGGGDMGGGFDSASMPGYAWPGYAAHPNFAAVSYPRQYSPSAWPYIGPFYPYPQVPLGWRSVALEWDDGWWYLDFNEKCH